MNEQNKICYDLCIIDFFPQNFIGNNQDRVLNLQLGDIDLEDDLVPQGHGMAVLELAKSINPELNFVLVPITSKTKLNHINQILRYIIRSKLAYVVNMSFGFFSFMDIEWRELEKTCSVAKQNGIYLVSADSDSGKLAYPANFASVVCVKGEVNSKSDIRIDGHNIYVRYVSFKVNWIRNKKIWVHGSSYYAAIISGLLTKKLHNKNICIDHFNFKSLANKIAIRNGIIDPFTK